MPRKSKSSKLKQDVFTEICDQLGIKTQQVFLSSGSSITTVGLKAILHKVSSLTGFPPKGLSKKEEEIWRLLHKSQESFVLSLEMINKITIPYRIECFSFLLISAWELLLKAQMLKVGKEIRDNNNPQTTKGFRHCARVVFGGDQGAEYKNLVAIEALRNEAAHLFIYAIPPSIMFVFQASVKNYENNLAKWFKIDITEKILPGMMFLIVDANPASWTPLALKKKLSPESFIYLQRWKEMIKNEIDGLNENDIGRFFLPIDIKLAYVNNPKKADTVQYLGKTGPKVTKALKYVENPDKSHPFFTAELVAKLKEINIQITSYDISVVLEYLFRIKGEKKYCYISIKHRRPQYSHAFRDWIIRETSDDPYFLQNCRDKYKKQKKAERSK